MNEVLEVLVIFAYRGKWLFDQLQFAPGYL